MTDGGNSQPDASKLDAILKNAVDAIITIDDQGVIDSANPATEKMFGFSQAELIGQNVKMLMPNPIQEQHDGYLRAYLTTGIRQIIGIGRETIGVRRDGTTFPIHVAVSESTFDNRRQFTGVVRDISDLKAIESKLAQANERLEERVRQRTLELEKVQSELVRNEKYSTLGKVAGGIAHEIRNPLNAIKTSAYFLLHATQPSPEKTREHLERIDRQVTMINNVVTALSDVVKLPDATLELIDLQPILRSIIQSIPMDPNVQTEFKFNDRLPMALADTSQISIAFKNLIRNARDAMPDGGTITISAVVDPDGVHVTIADTGTGIPESKLETIFEPLYTTKARGMGLGLSITKAIVEKNGGLISVKSEPGRGSHFCIHLKTNTSSSDSGKS